MTHLFSKIAFLCNHLHDFSWKSSNLNMVTLLWIGLSWRVLLHCIILTLSSNPRIKNNSFTWCIAGVPSQIEHHPYLQICAHRLNRAQSNKSHGGIVNENQSTNHCPNPNTQVHQVVPRRHLCARLSLYQGHFAHHVELSCCQFLWPGKSIMCSSVCL